MAGALLLLIIGVLFFTQTAVGDAVQRLGSFAPWGEEPDNAGPRGSAFTPGKSSSSKSGAFINALKSQLGQTYVWGGESRKEGGFDCSGLGYWAMRKTVAPNFSARVSSQQIAHARKMSVSKALRTEGACLYTPGHIAYSIGNGRDVIEASGSQDRTVIQDGRGRFQVGGIFPELA